MKIETFTIEVEDIQLMSIFMKKYSLKPLTQDFLDYIHKEYNYVRITNDGLCGINFKDDNHFVLSKDTYPFICDFYEKMISVDEDSKPNTITAQEFTFMFKQNPPNYLRRGQWFMNELAKINPLLYDIITQTELDCFAKHSIPDETMNYVIANWEKYLNWDEAQTKTIEQKYHDLLEENTRLKQIIFNIRNLVQ